VRHRVPVTEGSSIDTTIDYQVINQRLYLSNNLSLGVYYQKHRDSFVFSSWGLGLKLQKQLNDYPLRADILYGPTLDFGLLADKIHITLMTALPEQRKTHDDYYALVFKVSLFTIPALRNLFE